MDKTSRQSGRGGRTIFFAPEQLALEDKPHTTEQEARYILIGKTKQARMLFIVYTLREEKIRIISSRDADKKEVSIYEEAVSAAKV